MPRARAAARSRFYGQRAADGAYILGTIRAGNDTVTVDATGFPTVTQIDRIN